MVAEHRYTSGGYNLVCKKISSSCTSPQLELKLFDLFHLLTNPDVVGILSRPTLFHLNKPHSIIGALVSARKQSQHGS